VNTLIFLIQRRNKMSTGPIAINVDNIGLGLADIRIHKDWEAGAGTGEALIELVVPTLPASMALGKLSATKMNRNAEYYEIESGFPKKLNRVVPLKEEAFFEGGLHEVTPKNLELALGQTPDAAATDSGTVGFGTPVAPVYIRMEAFFTFPDGLLGMVIIFPKCQVTSSFEMTMSEEGEMVVPCKFQATDASSANADITTTNWDAMPLGLIYFQDDMTDSTFLASLDAGAP
jgi:hypothetical protein